MRSGFVCRAEYAALQGATPTLQARKWRLVSSGPLVAANRLRPAASSDHLVQHAGHPAAGETGVRLQGKALTGVSVDHAQHANRASGSDHVMSEVQSPFLVGRSGLLQRQPIAHAMLALLPLQAKPRGTVHPVQSLVVHSLSVALHWGRR